MQDDIARQDAARAAQRFANRPWTSVDRAAFPDAAAVPTMLAPEEQQFYLWASRDWARGDGAIVDLGAFVGGSTAWLAAGAAAAGHAAQVFAYDKFAADEATKTTQLYARGVPAFAGNDTRPLAERLLAPWRDRITFCQGEIERIGWAGGDIDILAVDAFKKVGLTDRMVAAFFPALVPGRSLIVQQDFLHWSQPWLAALMLRLGDAVHPLAYVPGDSVVYLVTAEMTAERLQRAALAGISDAELFEAVAETRDRMANWPIAGRFDRMQDGIRRNPGVRVAWQMKR